jgi:hypothetical protein
MSVQTRDAAGSTAFQVATTRSRRRPGFASGFGFGSGFTLSFWNETGHAWTWSTHSGIRRVETLRGSVGTGFDAGAVWLCSRCCEGTKEDIMFGGFHHFW